METNKHAGGRPPKFKTPEELQEKAEGYFEWCDDNPVRICLRKNAGASQTAGKGSGVKSDEGEAFVERPYTRDGLALWLGVSDWDHFKDSECYKTEEFLRVIRTLEARIRDRQVTGAMVKVYDTNLTARLNGIADKKNVNVNTKQQQTAKEALEALMGVADD